MAGERYVAVVGPIEATPEEIERAEEVGRLLAARRVVVVCGGLGGVMEAVARGAHGEALRSLRSGRLPVRTREESS